MILIATLSISLFVIVLWLLGIYKRKKIFLIYFATIVFTYGIIALFACGDITPLTQLGYVFLICSIFNIFYGYWSKERKGDFSLKEIRLMGYVMILIGILMVLFI